jgi:RNA polymerase sigma-70 factor (ECF subfamily)
MADWGGEHGHAVRGYLLAMVRRPEVADDLTQEVFFRAWQARERYREDGTARAYLFRIADNLACDWGRKSGREVHLSDEGWTRVESARRFEEPADPLVRQEASQELAAALDALSPVERRVLLLRYYGDLSFAAIAEIIGCPLGTALSHCHRGLLALRKLLIKARP